MLTWHSHKSSSQPTHYSHNRHGTAARCSIPVPRARKARTGSSPGPPAAIAAWRRPGGGYCISWSGVWRACGRGRGWGWRGCICGIGISISMIVVSWVCAREGLLTAFQRSSSRSHRTRGRCWVPWRLRWRWGLCSCWPWCNNWPSDSQLSQTWCVNSVESCNCIRNQNNKNEYNETPR